MAVMKWSSQNILDFLEIYEKYPLLWNIKHKDYANVKLKEEVFKRMFDQLDEGLLKGMTEKQLKCKIKSLKDVYRQEVAKIEKSKTSGSGTGRIYFPKLVWFKKARFLAGVMSTRKSQPSLDVTLGHWCNEVEQVDTLQETSPSKSPRKMNTPKRQVKIIKEVPETITDALYHLDRIARIANEDKPYEEFGKYVAAELRQLTQRQATMLQLEIQSAITRAKLSYDPDDHSYHFTEERYVISPSSTSITTSATMTDDRREETLAEHTATP